MNGRATYCTSVEFKWLIDHARNVYSQYGEDGIVEAIFSRIGTATAEGWCFECGAADGVMFSNTRRAIERWGWKGLLVEQDPEAFKRLSALKSEGVVTLNTTLEVEGDNRIDALLAAHDAPREPDLVCIDIDGQDFHVWNSMIGHWPRVVIIEHAVAGTVDDHFIPTVGGPGISGAAAIRSLAGSKGYRVACETFTNSIAVRGDLVPRLAEPVTHA